MTQMRPALLAKNPGISSKEAIAWSSKHWQQLDSEVHMCIKVLLFLIVVFFLICFYFIRLSHKW